LLNGERGGVAGFHRAGELIRLAGGPDTGAEAQAQRDTDNGKQPDDSLHVRPPQSQASSLSYGFGPATCELPSLRTFYPSTRVGVVGIVLANSIQQAFDGRATSR